MKKLLFVLSFVLLVGVFATPVLAAPAAQEETPPASEPAPVGWLDVGLFVASVAFFTTQFNLSGKSALGAAFVVGAFFAFGPLLVESLPNVSPWLLTLFDYLRFVIFGAGSYDAVIGIGTKIAKAGGK